MVGLRPGPPTAASLLRGLSPEEQRAVLARGTARESRSANHVVAAADFWLFYLAPVWGTPILAYGPGDSALDHTPDEHIQVSEYLKSVDVLESVLRTLCA